MELEKLIKDFIEKYEQKIEFGIENGEFTLKLEDHKIIVRASTVQKCFEKMDFEIHKRIKQDSTSDDYIFATHYKEYVDSNSVENEFDMFRLIKYRIIDSSLFNWEKNGNGKLTKEFDLDLPVECYESENIRNILNDFENIKNLFKYFPGKNYQLNCDPKEFIKSKDIIEAVTLCNKNI